MIRPYRGVVPTVPVSAYVDIAAVVIGDVIIGARSSVWPNVTIRGDVNFIRIGEETSIQDNSCLHVQRNTHPLVIGNRVTVGHSVTLHGCEVEDECLIAIGAIVLNGAKVGRGSIIAAGALVPEGMQVPPSSVVMGVPGKVKRAVTDAEREGILHSAANYVRYLQTYKEDTN
ncbi:MAG TPA: gamma carbonic anhydrase family protein [Bryobacteraceae bacterium]|nr:gamma carbonic anhydrase family protein [Bryobacteraceae bacterium]